MDPNDDERWDCAFDFDDTYEDDRPYSGTILAEMEDYL